MEDAYLLEDALLEGVENGKLVAKCGQCKTTLTPEDHEMGVCPSCGPLTEASKPFYSVPD